jgi:hypothetical protein
MAFLEEDGTGLAAANSYGNVAGFKAYHKDRGNDLPTGTSSGGIEDALVNGTDYVDRRFRTRFIGRRKEDVQRLQWPRTLARYRDGRLIDPDSLPQELLEAVYEYGLISLSEELAPVPTVDEIKSDSLMALFNETTIANLAKSLIEQSGRNVTFVKLSSSVDDSAKPWRGATTARSAPSASTDAYATFVPPSGAAELGLSTQDVEWVKRSEQICLVALGADSTVDLATYDELLDGSQRWKITGIETLKPANTILLYFVGVKR